MKEFTTCFLKTLQSGFDNTDYTSSDSDESDESHEKKLLAFLLEKKSEGPKDPIKDPKDSSSYS